MTRRERKYTPAGKEPPEGWKASKDRPISIIETGTGIAYHGTVRLKEVRCGKPNCRKCPHKIYAYAQFRKGRKVTEVYLGVAR